MKTKSIDTLKRIEGVIELEEMNIETGKKTILEKHNLITQLLYNKLFGFMNADNVPIDCNSLNITHLALGTGTTAVTSADTKLAAELFRKGYTTKTQGLASFQTKVIIAPAEAVGNIKEIGLFANATDTADSGTLLSRLLIDRQKTAVLQWTIIYTYMLT